MEACPASDDVTNITVDFEIEPNGKVKMLTCGDQIHSKPFYCWGWSCPQASVDAELLHQLTLRIAHQAKARKVLGFVKITFLTFLDDQNCQHVWATGMKVKKFFSRLFSDFINNFAVRLHHLTCCTCQNFSNFQLEQL